MTKSIEVTFPKLNHFWLDSGLLGLFIMLKDVDSNIVKNVSDKGLTFIGTESDIQNALEKAYELLIKRYYNLSTKKQKDEVSTYNFYYNSKTQKFVSFPKRNSTGIAGLIFGKALRPLGYSINWVKKEKREIEINGKKVKKTRGTLPAEYAHLQEEMDTFLDKHGINVTTAGLLVDGPNAVKPKVTIKVKEGRAKGVCFLCGMESHGIDDAKETIFPFITGSSGVLSFNSQGGRPEKVCWKCAFLGKFVPVNGFYLSQGDNFFAFFPYSVSFEKMIDVYAPLQDAKYEDPALFKNFKHPLGFEKFEGGYFQKPFEVAFAFLYTLYRKVLLHQKNDDDKGVLNWEEMCDFTFSKAPLEFVVLHAESKGQTSMGKIVWPFRDSVYFFRLIKELEEIRINIKEVMRLLIDFSQKNQENKTILRNRFCERILKKKTVLDIVEERAWDIVFPQDQKNSKPQNPLSLIDFFLKYESIIKEGKMTDEERSVAVTLGKTIGLCVSKKDNETRSKNEIERDLKRLKGDLIKLKKVRKLTDFLSEIERLEVRYDFSLRIPDGLLEGKLRDDNFREFKGYCTIAAMQAYSNARYYALKEGN